MGIDEELRAAEHSGDALKHAIQLRRAGRLEECADTLERAWLGGDPSFGNVFIHFLDEWREHHAVAVATRLDRLACAGNERARTAWENWFPELTKIVGVSANMQGLRRTVLEHVARPFDSILILRGGEGVGKTVAARVLHELTKGSKFVIWEPHVTTPCAPPENGTLNVEPLEHGTWEARCIEDCRARHTRVVINYELSEVPPWQTLHKVDHVDYFVTELDSRPEDIPELALKAFPKWLRSGYSDPPQLWIEQVKTIHIQPEAMAELSRRSWGVLNARSLFYCLDGAAERAFRASDPATLTIGVEHLGRLGTGI